MSETGIGQQVAQLHENCMMILCFLPSKV